MRTRRRNAAPTEKELHLVEEVTEFFESGCIDEAVARLSAYGEQGESRALEELSSWDLAEHLDLHLVEHMLDAQRCSILVSLLLRRTWRSLCRRMTCAASWRLLAKRRITPHGAPRE